MLLIKRFLKSEKYFFDYYFKKGFKKKKTNFKYDFQNFIKQRTIKILIKHKKYT